MANDIQLIINETPIKNGTSVISCSKTGQYSTLDTYVSNSPAIENIQNKYDTRFDDITYYFGGTAS